VLSLYSDRLIPTVGELQQRLREQGVGFAQIRSSLASAARRPDLFRLVPPLCSGQPGESSLPVVLLRSTPPWFKGFCLSRRVPSPSREELSVSCQSEPDESVWRALEEFLVKHQIVKHRAGLPPALPGSVHEAAVEM
ncbi:unnamed protein product, partial [Polarella glacialis]